MKKSIPFIFLTLVFACQPIRAQVMGGFTVTIDEFCRGFFQQDNQPPQQLPCDLFNDVQNGVMVPRFHLPLTAPVTPGDVLLTAPDDIEPSDLLRFSPSAGDPTKSFEFCFYSERPDPPELPDPSDVGIPGLLQPNLIGITEIGTETGNNGAVYTPGLLMPGGPVTGGPPGPNVFNIISDGTSVPEPGSICLAAIGLGGLIAFAWRKTRRAPPIG
jgi:hypothetical protein